MKSFHANRYLDALIKVIILIVIIHLISLGIAAMSGTVVGLGGLKVLWPHISSGFPNTLIALVVAVAAYFGIWKFYTKD